jgi:tetratricopeptide (TPR) repeat protein
MDDSTEPNLASVDLPEFGRRLRATRRARGMTQDAVAGQEISAAYVSRIEAGQRRPEPAVARLLAERLGTTLEYLLTGIEPRKADETRLAVRYAALALKTGQPAAAEAQLRALQESGEPLGVLTDEVVWLLALCLEALGRLDDAVEILEQLVAGPTTGMVVQASIALSRCYREAGDLARAIDVGERARRRAADVGLDGTDDDIRLTATLVAAYQERGDEAYAAQLCREAIKRAEENSSAPARAAAYWNASILASRRGRHGEAITLAERALVLMSEGEDDRNIARLRSLLGLLSLREDAPDIDTAQAHLQRAYDELRQRDGSPVDLARCELGLAQTLLLSGQAERAAERASKALEAVGAISPFVSASAEALIGRAGFARGDHDGARDHFRNAVAFLTGAHSDREAAQLWYELGELLEAVGEDSAARDAFRSAAASTGLRSAARVIARV